MSLDPKMPKDNAERVVTGARHLSPFLGERMASAHLLNKPVFIRELLPQDLKLEIDQLSATEAVDIAEFLARVVGKAHARQMDPDNRQRWLAEIKRNRSKSLGAPFDFGAAWSISSRRMKPPEGS